MPTSRNSSPEPVQASKTAASRGKLLWTLNGLIFLLLMVTGIFSYKYFIHPDEPAAPVPVVPVKSEQQPKKPLRVVQLDVLNGCGAKGIGSKITTYLRGSGFDVVEMKNYKTFHVNQTMVVDRVGNLETAKQVARALGIDDKNIIQQINPDYYVDVSVIIGKDYTDLKMSR
ncbi:MAG: LytR C-terminal domain-containing protein [Bacteroidota bacterium]